MTLVLDLPPHLAETLTVRSQAEGLTPQEYLAALVARDAETKAESDQAAHHTRLSALLDQFASSEDLFGHDPAVAAYRQSPQDDPLVEKFRWQGLNL